MILQLILFMAIAASEGQSPKVYVYDMPERFHNQSRFERDIDVAR